MVHEVLPDVPYAQLVFTIPKMLRRAVLFDRKLYGELCRSAYGATGKFFEVHFPGLEKAVAAMVAAPQSFGSLLNFHPHVHAVCSLGVFTRDGVFHPVPEDLDFTPLEGLFRDEVFRAFLKRGAVTEERVELLRSWRHSGFGVDASRRVAKGEREELEFSIAATSCRRWGAITSCVPDWIFWPCRCRIRRCDTSAESTPTARSRRRCAGSSAGSGGRRGRG